jgi:L-ribulose-5-phosphate 4-epimerase
MKFSELREAVCHANKEIGRIGLAKLTWGNASAVDRKAGVMAIKPSGVDYGALKQADIVVLAISTGVVVDGKLRPSSDTPTHLHLYRSFDSIGGIVHTHSHFATVWAQAERDLPCFGTTHADHFYGAVPCTRRMKRAEIQKDYELNTGRVIVERFARGKIDASQVAAVLVANHAPFVWGPDIDHALENAIALEEVAKMALHTLQVSPGQKAISRELLDKHFLRKHGATAYYGQKSG